MGNIKLNFNFVSIQLQVQGRQSLNGADISSDLFGGDELVLPGR